MCKLIFTEKLTGKSYFFTVPPVNMTIIAMNFGITQTDLKMIMMKN